MRKKECCNAFEIEKVVKWKEMEVSTQMFILFCTPIIIYIIHAVYMDDIENIVTFITFVAMFVIPFFLCCIKRRVVTYVAKMKEE